MEYPEVFNTRLTSDLGAKVRAMANDLEIGESAVLRMAVKEFFKTPWQARQIGGKPKAAWVAHRKKKNPKR